MRPIDEILEFAERQRAETIELLTVVGLNGR